MAHTYQLATGLARRGHMVVTGARRNAPLADRLRSNPGEHYLSYFSEARIRNSTASSTLTGIYAEADYGELSYDRVVNEANAHGARVYTVQAEGMTNLATGVATGRSATRVTAVPWEWVRSSSPARFCRQRRR